MHFRCLYLNTYSGNYKYLIPRSFGTTPLLKLSILNLSFALFILLPKQYRVLPSTYLVRWEWATKKRSFNKMLNNKGPRMEPSGTPMRIISHALKLLFILTPLFAAFKTASQASHFSSIVNKQCWVFRFFLKRVNNGGNLSFIHSLVDLFIHWFFKTFWHIWNNTYRTIVFIDSRSKQGCVQTYHHGRWKTKLNSNIFLLIWNKLYGAASEINFEIHATTLWKETKYKSFWKKLLKNKRPLRRKTSKNRK